MSIIVLSTIFLEKELEVHDSVLIDEVLSKYCDKVSGIRKGRVWVFEKNNKGFSIDVRPTENALNE